LTNPLQTRFAAYNAAPSGENPLLPVPYLLHSGRLLMRNGRLAFQDKRFLLGAAALTVTWTILPALHILGMDSSPIRLLTFLTFAHGGLSAGLLGAVGGVVGKAVYGSLILSLMVGKRPLTGVGAGLQRLPAALRVRGIGDTIPLLIGSGIAFLSFNFLVGRVSAQDSVIGIVASLLVVQSMGRPTGFWRGFLQSVQRAYLPAEAEERYPDRILAGLATGFALSVLLAGTAINVLGYLLGIGCAAAAILLGILLRRAKEVPAR